MPADFIERIRRLLIPVTIGLAVASCGGIGGGGGGGGSEGDNYPGYTELQVERDSLDSGDLTDVTLTVYDINPNGVFVKFHYPASLKYQAGSLMSYSGDADSWVTTTPFDSVTVGTDKYLVLRVTRPPEDESNRVAISLTLRAVSGDPSAYIEVDLDNNDLTIPDGQEFDNTNPQFSSDDRWNISIAGPAAATPTPAATGSVTPAATTTPGN